MPLEVTPTPPESPHATPGTDVEVLIEYSGRWVPGFAVAESSDEGYRLRRKSDRALLPDWIPRQDVRANRG